MVTLRKLILSAIAILMVGAALPSVASAGPRLAWAQIIIPLPRFACATRAERAIRAVYSWQWTRGKQHVTAESSGMVGWIRCWEVSGGRSVVTVVVTGGPNYLVDRLRREMTSFMRTGGY